MRRGDYELVSVRPSILEIPNDETGEYDRIETYLGTVRHVPSGEECSMYGSETAVGEQTLDYAEAIERAGNWAWQRRPAAWPEARGVLDL